VEQAEQAVEAVAPDEQTDGAAQDEPADQAGRREHL
jgi:hypothetical protein